MCIPLNSACPAVHMGQLHRVLERRVKRAQMEDQSRCQLEVKFIVAVGVASDQVESGLPLWETHNRGGAGKECEMDLKLQRHIKEDTGLPWLNPLTVHILIFLPLTDYQVSKLAHGNGDGEMHI